jgi:hypothetical protein
MTLLELLVFLHIAGAICWVGSGSFTQLYGVRTIGQGRGPEIQSFIGTLVWLTPRWFIPVSIWTVAFGIAAAIEGSFAFGDAWVSAGLTMFVISFLIGMLYLGPQTERIAAIGESDGPDSAAYGANVKKLLFASRIELTLLWLTVFVMVVKPG